MLHSLRRLGASASAPLAALALATLATGAQAQVGQPVPEDVAAQADAIKNGIVAGTHHPFTGPIKKQDGSDWLAEGETADDGTLLGMNFYVEGVDGELPS